MKYAAKRSKAFKLQLKAGDRVTCTCCGAVNGSVVEVIKEKPVGTYSLIFTGYRVKLDEKLDDKGETYLYNFLTKGLE